MIVEYTILLDQFYMLIAVFHEIIAICGNNSSRIDIIKTKNLTVVCPKFLLTTPQKVAGRLNLQCYKKF
jgi:hypothetical protein